MTDNLKKQLDTEIDNLNKEYFGLSDFLSKEQKPGQLARYNSDVDLFWLSQKNSLTDYFIEQNWNWTDARKPEGYGNIIGEENSVRITYTREYQDMTKPLHYLTIEKNIGEKDSTKKVYQLYVESDFQENPHYKQEPGSSSYRNTKRVPNDDGLKMWADEIRKVVEDNKKLNGNYNFRLTAGLWNGSSYVQLNKEYKNLMELVNTNLDEN